MTKPDLTVVVLSWNTKELTLACLEALARDSEAHGREIIVVDNASEDGSAAAIAERFEQVKLQRSPKNLGYAAGNNLAARLGHGRFLCLLGSDTEVRRGALDALCDFLETSPTYGAVAPKLLDRDGRVQHGCMRFPGLATALCYDTVWGRFWPGSRIESRYFMRDFDHLHSRDVPQPPGTCLLMRRREFLEMGGLDESMFLFFNDVDLCRRLWQGGRRIRYLAEAEVVHAGGASTRRFQKFVVTWFRNRLVYYRKHYGPLAVPFMRLVVRLRALEEWFQIGRRHADRADVRAERRDLRAHLREILAP